MEDGGLSEGLGQALLRLRLRRRLSQRQLAAAAGVAPSTITLYENGPPPDLDCRRLGRLLAALRCDLGDLCQAREQVRRGRGRPRRRRVPRNRRPGRPGPARGRPANALVGLPAALRTLRLARGLTQRELVAASGVSYFAVTSWESGRVWPRLGGLGRLLAALDADLPRLAGELAEPRRDLPRRRPPRRASGGRPRWMVAQRPHPDFFPLAWAAAALPRLPAGWAGSPALAAVRRSTQ
jgi:transcriptional regulator with XRE-family HTH domain